MQEFHIISFEDLAKRPPIKKYDPSRDAGKGVVRLGNCWSSRLGEGSDRTKRNDLIRIASDKRSRVYSVKFTPKLDGDTIAIDYDQKVELGLNRATEYQLEITRAGRFGMFPFLWHHVDPAMRWPFRTAMLMLLIGPIVGLDKILSLFGLW